MANRFYKKRRYPEWAGSSLADYTHTTDGLVTNGQLEFRAMGADRLGNTHFTRGIPDSESIYCLEVVNAADGSVRKLLNGVGYDYVLGNGVKTNKIQIRQGFEPADEDVVILKYQIGEGC